VKTALLLSALLASACVAPSPTVVDAARRGREDAERDVARGRPRLAIIGAVPDDESPLDPESGLVRFSAGCCKSHERMAYVEAYDDVVAAAAKSGRLPTASFLARTTTRPAVAARLASGAVALEPGRPAIDSPDGRYRVEIGPSGGFATSALWRVDRASGEREELRYLGGERAVVVIDGASLLLRDDAAHLYATFDLPTALPLQVFPDAPRR
jgi:hypothetical protein